MGFQYFTVAAKTVSAGQVLHHIALEGAKVVLRWKYIGRECVPHFTNPIDTENPNVVIIYSQGCTLDERGRYEIMSSASRFDAFMNNNGSAYIKKSSLIETPIVQPDSYIDITGNENTEGIDMESPFLPMLEDPDCQFDSDSFLNNAIEDVINMPSFQNMDFDIFCPGVEDIDAAIVSLFENVDSPSFVTDMEEMDAMNLPVLDEACRQIDFTAEGTDPECEMDEDVE